MILAHIEVTNTVGSIDRLGGKVLKGLNTITVIQSANPWLQVKDNMTVEFGKDSKLLWTLLKAEQAPTFIWFL